MLGPPKARHVDRPVLASLEDLVPPGHFYRHLEAALDLSFVRELVRDRYAGIGRPSLDPVVFFKLQLDPLLRGAAQRAQARGDGQPAPGPPLVPGLRPGRAAARPLHPEQGPAAPGRGGVPALLRARGGAVPGGRPGVGARSCSSTPRGCGPTPTWTRSCPGSGGWSATTSRPSSPRAATPATSRRPARRGRPRRLQRPSCRCPRGRSRRPRRPRAAPAGGGWSSSPRGGTCWTGAASTRPAPWPRATGASRRSGSAAPTRTPRSCARPGAARPCWATRPTTSSTAGGPGSSSTP